MLLYRIDPKEKAFLRVFLEEKSPLRRRVLYLSTLKELARAEDREALQLLVKIRRQAAAGQSLETLSFQQIDVKRTEAAEALRLLAQTQRLFYNGVCVQSAAEAERLWRGPKEEKTEPVLPPKKEAPQPVTVLPQLELHDATGCFGALWLLYSDGARRAIEDLAPREKRLQEEEKSWERDLIEAGYQRKAVGRSRYYCPGDRVADALGLLLDVGWQVIDPLGKRVEKFSDWSCELTEEAQAIVLKAGERTRKALQAVQEGRAWVDLGQTQGWIDRKEALKLFEGFLGGEWEGEALKIPKQRLAACTSLLGQNVSWSRTLKEAAGQLAGGWETALPGAGFSGTLLPYQQTGVNWLSFIHRWGFGGLLADEMGLGKTVQLLAFFSRLRTNLPTLIVVPTSLLYNWRAEFSRFFPAAPVKIHAGPHRDAVFEGFVLTSYAILRQDEEALKKVEWETVVLDESSAIKNLGAKATQTVLTLKAKARFCINGTPIENRAQELASQFAFLLPDLLSQSDTPESMQYKAKPFLLRRQKSQVAIELPEKIDQIVWVEMGSLQAALYEEFQKSALKRLKPLIAQDGASAHRMEILEAVLRLRQICCDPRLVGAKEAGVKIEQALADIDALMAEGRKVLFYSQFTSMLHLVERPGCLRIDGSTPAAERAEQVRRFQEEEGPALFLLSLKAGGVGLNLTAADTVLLFDPWWNEAVERQAIDRAHRIGRRGTVFVKRYLVEGSIEEKMLSLKASKQALADQILDGETAASAWSADELLALI